LQRNVLINQEDIFHLRLKLGITLFQIVLDSFRVQRLGGENTMYRGFGCFRQRWMPGLFGPLAHMPGQQASRPQFGGVTVLLRFGTSQSTTHGGW